MWLHLCGHKSTITYQAAVVFPPPKKIKILHVICGFVSINIEFEVF